MGTGNHPLNRGIYVQLADELLDVLRLVHKYLTLKIAILEDNVTLEKLRDDT